MREQEPARGNPQAVASGPAPARIDWHGGVADRPIGAATWLRWHPTQRGQVSGAVIDGEAPTVAIHACRASASFDISADCELVARMHAGDERALSVLYDRYATLVHSVVRRVTSDRCDAEEVVEETFWQAWRQAERFDPGRGGIATWLVMIARSRALDRVRSRRTMEVRIEPQADGEMDQIEDAARPSPLDDATNEERRRRVTEVLATLPAEQRRPLELAYFRGMSQSEIAAATGERLGTVKTRVRLAMQKLRDGLAALREEGEYRRIVGNLA